MYASSREIKCRCIATLPSTGPEIIPPAIPTWSQYFSSMLGNMNGWLHNLRNWTMVFIRALAPPFDFEPKICYERDCLDGLAETHLVSENTVQVVVVERYHPFKTFDLVLFESTIDHNRCLFCDDFVNGMSYAVDMRLHVLELSKNKESCLQEVSFAKLNIAPMTSFCAMKALLAAGELHHRQIPYRNLDSTGVETRKMSKRQSTILGFIEKKPKLIEHSTPSSSCSEVKESTLSSTNEQESVIVSHPIERSPYATNIDVEILTYTVNLSKVLQATSIDRVTAMNMICQVLELLESKRKNVEKSFDAIYAQALVAKKMLLCTVTVTVGAISSKHGVLLHRSGQWLSAGSSGESWMLRRLKGKPATTGICEAKVTHRYSSIMMSRRGLWMLWVAHNWWLPILMSRMSLRSSWWHLHGLWRCTLWWVLLRHVPLIEKLHNMYFHITF
nr:unnamed protein product [Callosobruchus chinensis]